MSSTRNPFGVIIFKVILLVILLYLVFVPVFIILNNSYEANDFGLIFVIMNTIRLLLVVFIGLYIRKKNRSILQNSKEKGKRYYIIILIILGISILLNLLNIPTKVYGTISSSIGIYSLKNTPMFFIVFLEQIFANYMFTSILFCLVIVFFYRPLKSIFGRKR